MNSGFLCVLLIGVLVQVFAESQFHSKLWWTSLKKINEDNEKRKAYELADYISKTKADELADFISGNSFVDLDRSPRMAAAEKSKAYFVCAEKTGVSPDTILSIKGGDWTYGDRKAKDWVQCVLMEHNLMTAQSVLQLDVAFKNLSRLERQSLEEKIDKCLPNLPMPPVEISWKFAKCFQTADPENSLF